MTDKKTGSSGWERAHSSKGEGGRGVDGVVRGIRLHLFVTLLTDFDSIRSCTNKSSLFT